MTSHQGKNLPPNHSKSMDPIDMHPTPLTSVTITISILRTSKKMSSSVKKRRRSSSQNDDNLQSKDRKVPPNDRPRNPFLHRLRSRNMTSSMINVEDDSRGCDDTFELVVNFLDLTRRHIFPALQHGSSSVAKTEKDISEIAKQLLDKLVQERGSPVRPTPKLISVGDIANLLLPCSIKVVLRSDTPQSTRELEWKILQQCTELSMEYQQNRTSSAVSQELSTHFSLSNLHKLVPLAWAVALHGESSVGHVVATKEVAASCYRYWVQNLYRPSFDIVCQLLMPLVGEAAQRRLNGDTSMDNDLYDDMTSATLMLLQATLNKANPKKAFSTLIQPHMMSALSDVHAAPANDFAAKQSVVRQLIDDGIFHGDHHLDGFRSIQMTIPSLNDLGQNISRESLEKEEGQSSPTKKSFQCYQNGLLTMVHTAFADPSSTHLQVVSIARMVPLLLEGFVRASNSIHNHKDKAVGSAGKRKASTNKIGQLQMAFFANLVAPVLRFACNNKIQTEAVTVTALCDSMYQCMNILLRYDIYLPSSDDEGFKNFGFLKQLSHALLEHTTTPSSNDLAIKPLPVLATALQLNHLVFHENLSETIASCLVATGSLDNTTPLEAVPFFCQMIITYKQLRQLDYLCAAVRSAAVDLATRNRTTALHSFLVLTENMDILHEFFDAVQNSPIQQIKKIVSEYSIWIQSESDSCNRVSNSTRDAMPIVIKVFCLLLKSSRVDAASAHELSPLCQDIGSKAVKALIPESTSLKSLNDQSRHGLLLCAWTLDMSNRCDFWLKNSREADKDDHFDLPFCVLSILSEGVDQISNNSNIDFNGALEEMLLLACHRLQQLHGRIHEKQRVSFASDAEEFSISADIQETKHTANFVLSALQLETVDGPGFNRRWDSVAAAIGSWAPYVNNETMRWFLLTLCSRLSADGVDGDSAMWLLRDASFLETPNVLEHFGPSVISHVASSLQKVFGDEKTGEHFWRDLSCSPFSSLWAPLQVSEMAQILRGNEDVKIGHVKESMRSHLPGVLRSLQMLNSIKAATWHSSSQYSEWLQTCVRMDYVCGALAKQSGDSDLVLIDLMSEIRKTMSRLMSENQRSDPHKDMPWIILSNLFQSTLGLLLEGTVELSKCHGLIDSTKGTISTLIRTAPEPSVFHVAIREYYDDESAHMNGLGMFLLTTFGCAVVAELPNTKQALAMVERICDSVWGYATRVIVDAGNVDPSERRAAFLFVSQILRREAPNTHRMKSAEMLVLDAVQSIDEKDEEKLQYLAFLVGCFAAAEPSPESRLSLFDSLTGFTGTLPEIIEDAMCHLVVGMNSNDLSECLAKLTDIRYSNTRLRSHLRLLRLIMLNARSDEQFEAISRSSREFFSLALGAMTSAQQRNRTIGEGVALIQVIASNRKIMSIRERELCLILSHTVGALQLPSDDQATTVCKTVFDSCFLVVSLMLQRFSKQLHNCIPSLISCLSVILGRCLYDELSDLEIIDRGHKFSRLTELLLPYGEVYKKHVLSLVVEFVRALKQDMNPTRRSSLSPAVYCLLDILQHHETTQLNSMLDDMGRALLRTVHESYKKQHVYKGQ